MNYERALQLKPGDRVTYPRDRGEQGGSGTVAHVSTEPQTSVSGDRYVWVSVRLADKLLTHQQERDGNTHRTAVWPSNRLN